MQKKQGDKQVMVMEPRLWYIFKSWQEIFFRSWQETGEPSEDQQGLNMW